MIRDLSVGRVTVLAGDNEGRYPHGNSVVIRGTEATAIIDPSQSLVAGPTPAGVDVVLNSHVHEDHFAGNFLFPEAAVQVHERDLLGLRSLEGLLTVYGMSPDVELEWRDVLLRDFHYTPRPDALGFVDGHTIDLGGTGVRALHLPGHTRGHCGFLIEPEGVAYFGDIDLTGFGPYYGDAWSSLDEFEASLKRCAEVDARWFATFHHQGVIDGRESFLEMLDEFAAVIGRRDERLLEFLGEPHTLDDIVAYRFVYRDTVDLPWVDYVERRMMSQHLDRLVASDRVTEVEPGRYRAP